MCTTRFCNNLHQVPSKSKVFGGYYVPDEGYYVHDEGYYVHDEGYYVPDEGYYVHDKDYYVPDEGYYVRSKSKGWKPNNFKSFGSK